jgi:hypothetical protein
MSGRRKRVRMVDDAGAVEMIDLSTYASDATLEKRVTVMKKLNEFLLYSHQQNPDVYIYTDYDKDSIPWQYWNIILGFYTGYEMDVRQVIIFYYKQI